MASNTTPNIGLCQWEPTDPVVRTDFNDDNAKIDEAIQSVLDQAAQLDAKIDSAAQASQTRDTQLDAKINTSVQSLQGTDAQLSSWIQSLQNVAYTTSNLPFVAGAYTGNGAIRQVIPLGFTPRAVLVLNWGQNAYNYAGTRATYYGGLAVTGRNVSGSTNLGITTWQDGVSILGIVAGGFQVSYYTDSSNVYIYANTAGAVYHYIALK